MKEKDRLDENAQLILRIHRGDSEALEQLLSKNRACWVGLAKQEPSSAEDFKQELSMRVVSLARRHDGAWQAQRWADPGAVSAYLRVTAKNLLRERLRKRGAQKRAGERFAASVDAQGVSLLEQIPSSAPGPEAQLLTAQMRSTVQKALARLSEDDQNLVLARVRDERDYSEMAKEWGVRGATLRVRYHRALSRLKDMLLTTTAGESI